MSGPAVGQGGARALLQAADQAIGANKVNSMQFTAKGRYSYPGQNFTVNDDWNRVDLQSYVLTIDYPSKSYKEEQVRVQGNNPKIGGGAGFPIVGEQRASANPVIQFVLSLPRSAGFQRQNLRMRAPCRMHSDYDAQPPQ